MKNEKVYERAEHYRIGRFGRIYSTKPIYTEYTVDPTCSSSLATEIYILRDCPLNTNSMLRIYYLQMESFRTISCEKLGDSSDRISEVRE